MTTKARARKDEAVAEGAPSAGAAEAVAKAEDGTDAASAAPVCADCGSLEVVVSTGQGDARRSFCDVDAPVNISDR